MLMLKIVIKCHDIKLAFPHWLHLQDMLILCGCICGISLLFFCIFVHNIDIENTYQCIGLIYVMDVNVCQTLASYGSKNRANEGWKDLGSGISDTDDTTNALSHIFTLDKCN